MDPAYAFYDDEYPSRRGRLDPSKDECGSFFSKGFKEHVLHFFTLRLGVILGSIYTGILLASLLAWPLVGFFEPLDLIISYPMLFAAGWFSGTGAFTFWPFGAAIVLIYANFDEEATPLTFWRSALVIMVTQGWEVFLLIGGAG